MKRNSSILKDYNNLLQKYRRIVILQSAKELLHWDLETKMPPRGIGLRSEQLAIISQLLHKTITDDEIGILLNRLESCSKFDDLNKFQRRNLHLIRKEYNEQIKIPEKLIGETEKQKALTISTWKKAKIAKDFSIFRPELEKLVNLKKEAANILMDVKKCSCSYDALIDIYEPRMTSNKVSNIFNDLKKGLIILLEDCRKSSTKFRTSFLRRKVPIIIQRQVSKELLKFLGYDISSEEAGGRIDETEHPFTSGYYDDVRITTHYYENNFSASLFSVLHEAGHAIYHQNIDRSWIYTPIGDSCSLGIHESQSRLVENIIGRSYEFWTHFYPKFQRLTKDTFSDIELENFFSAINQVIPSKIRVEADEVTYCLHVIIRFELEKDLMENKLSVSDLPEAWNSKYEEYLGVNIENDAEGVMQDTHWASGLQGYFPTYALGNIYSGQILAKMDSERPDWKKEIERGDFNNTRRWLKEKVHKYGNLYDPSDLVKKVSGKDVTVKPYISYLRDKYSNLYGF